MKEGGAETRTREVAFRLARSGHRVTILCGKTNVSDPDVTVEEGVRIVSKKTLPTFLLRRFPYPHYISLAGANLFLMFHIRAFLKHENPDVIREDVAPFPPTFLLSLVRLKAKERIAVTHMLSRTLRGWIKFYGLVFGCAGFVMDRLLRAGKLKYDRIVCDSKWFSDELKEYPAITSKVSYIPNGVDLEQCNRTRARRDGNGRIRLLSVGRLTVTKGHRFAIEAVHRLKGEYPDVTLDIIGNGAMKEPLIRRAKELGVCDMVEIRPPIAHSELLRLYDDYDFFVMPSLWEGLPVSLIEAMASRLPIVASDITAIRDILDEGSATFAASEDAAVLAERLRWAFQHPEEVGRFAESAYEIAKRFDWNNTAKGEIEGI